VAKAIADGDSVEGNAVAGSGKTATLVAGASAIPQSRRTLACAFGKANQLDLEAKLPETIDCRTFNGLGHRTWGRHTARRLELDAKKVGKLTTDFCKRYQVQDLWVPIKDLVNKAKLNGLVPAEMAHLAMGLTRDTDENWKEMAFDYGIDFSPDILNVARTVLRESIALGLKGVVDFDDQLYLPVIFKSRFQTYDQVLVDEAQDLNAIQHIMVERSTGGAIASLGDPHQSIYGFRGAVANSMEALASKFSLRTLPMTFNFRCGRTIIEQAQAYVPHIQAWSGASDGSVGWVKRWSPTMFKPGDAILCKNNAPLITLAFRCIRDRIGVSIAGRDIGKALGTLIKSLCPGGEMLTVPLDVFTGLLSEWASIETLKARAKDDEAKCEAILDRSECLFAIMDGTLEARTALDLFEAAAHLFDKANGMVTLSTIHKAKGLEWSRVYFLDSWRLPSKFAKIAFEAGNPEPLRQENNLSYVAITRAKHELIFIDMKGCNGKEAHDE
jgi:superfamily I DNA/RNA helicase